MRAGMDWYALDMRAGMDCAALDMRAGMECTRASAQCVGLLLRSMYILVVEAVVLFLKSDCDCD